VILSVPRLSQVGSHIENNLKGVKIKKNAVNVSRGRINGVLIYSSIDQGHPDVKNLRKRLFNFNFSVHFCSSAAAASAA